MRRRPLFRMLLAVIGVLVTAEMGVRLIGPDLPEPIIWYHEIAQAKTEQIENHDGPLDLVFTGTSQSYHAIDPDLIDDRLGTRSYNAGIPAGIPTVQRRWLFDTVVPNLETDTVVWALSSVDLNAARPSPMAPVYDSAFATRKGLLAEVDRWLFDRMALFRHRRTLADPRSWSREDDPLGEARSVLLSSGKRTPGSINLTGRERRRVRQEVVGDFEVGGRMTEAIEETVEELEGRGIEVLFVWLPEAPRFVNLLPDPSAHGRAKDEAVRLAETLGVPFIDVSAGFEDDDFIDFTHIDGDAAQRLSARLSRLLASSGLSASGADAPGN